MYDLNHTRTISFDDKCLAILLGAAGFRSVHVDQEPGPYKQFYAAYKATNKLYATLRKIKTNTLTLNAKDILDSADELDSLLSTIASGHAYDATEYRITKASN